MQDVLNAYTLRTLREFEVCLKGDRDVDNDGVWEETVGTGTGTVTVNNEQGGSQKILNSGADNDDVYVNTISEIFDIGSRRAIYALANIKYTEANTDDANVMFGLSTGCAADTIVDGGEPASTVVAAIYKIDGGTVWKCQSVMDGVTKTSTTQETPGGGLWQTLGIQIQPQAVADEIEVTYWLDPGGGTKRFYADGTKPGLVAPFQLRDNTEYRNLIKHRVTVPTSTTCDLFLGVKNGGANAETVYVRWIYACSSYPTN